MSTAANRSPEVNNAVDEGAPDAKIGDTGVDVLSLALVLARRWRRIAIVTTGALLVGVLISLLLKPDFTSIAVIMPPQQQQSSASAVMGQLGSLLGGGASLGLKNPADMYVGLLQSRTIADRIIAKFDLMSVYRTKRMQDARAALAKHAAIEAAKDGLIRISVKDHSAQRASDIANAYIDELYAMNSTLAISEAAQRRLFFDRQLGEEKVALAAAEGDLKATQQRTGLIQLSGQAESIIRSIAELQAQISSREVQMAAMSTYATDQNPEVAVLRQEISGLQQQLNKLQNDQQHLAPGDTQIPASKVPEESLEYLQKLREVKYHETLFDLLSRQFEAARIDEAKSAPIIQVVDRAVPSDKKSGPHGSIITLGLGVVGFLMACLWAFLEQAWKRMSDAPESADKVRELKGIVRSRA
ncbi:MAG: Wzz/FepE/Etk N-terminal domain-containing protein [Terracidiphilus sp.]